MSQHPPSAAEALVGGIQRHWLTAVNTVVAIFVGLPFLAPVLLALGFDGAANAIYGAYHVVCHQWAFRSFFLFGPELTYGPETLGGLVGPQAAYGFIGTPDLGYKVAFCERDTAIYLAVLLAGMTYGRSRGWLPELGIVGYGLLILPMAVDGLTQLVGWRESTPELRVLTGALFGLASVWLIYPRIDAMFVRDLANLDQAHAETDPASTATAAAGATSA